MMKHLISINDLTRDEIEKILALATELKRNPAKFHSVLQGKKFGLIFEKPSTRTWISFDVGIFSLGGGTIYLGPEDIKLGVREEIRDVARVLSRYLEGVILRTFAHNTITQFQRYFQKPVINGLSDFEHPCQALADLFTLREKMPNQGQPVLAYVGDGNNVLNSLLLLFAKIGGHLKYATPKKHTPDKAVVAVAMETARRTNAVIEGFFDTREAVKNAEAVYTDVWVSMGQEKIRKKKLKDFKGMQVNDNLVAFANRDALIMHCLPAHRGEEITDQMLESKKSIVFDQAENRLHIQKAILLHLFASA
ncbi:MAG: ornithine carbamoyltransferase [Candidatus Omnitrophica bacterium]|nr:ornithine carbamoyltransferase [Candidatus Omnitrophota bacterium]